MESSNSTGLLSGLDVPSNSVYSDIAALEPVSEDQEGTGGTKLRTTGKYKYILIYLLFYENTHFSAERRFSG